MKRNLLGLAAVVFAIAVSSFTVKKATNVYMIYKGTGVEKSISSFNEATTAPAHVSGLGKLNWVRITDQLEDGIDQTEFDAQFEILDVNSDSSDKLSDESSDVAGVLDVRS